jgi:hypothetical protein
MADIKEFQFTLCIPSATQHFFFRTLAGAEAYLEVYRNETGKNTTGYRIIDVRESQPKVEQERELPL